MVEETYASGPELYTSSNFPSLTAAIVAAPEYRAPVPLVGRMTQMD